MANKKNTTTSSKNEKKNTISKPTLTDNDIKKTLNSNHIYTRSEVRENKFNKFSRFGFFDLYETSSNTREYIFFTKPDLHLFSPSTTTLNDEISNIPFFINCASSYKPVMCQLQQSADTTYTNNNPFCNLLTNTASSRIDLTDISIEELETAKNIYDNKMKYPLASTTSSNAQDFSVEFEDNKFLDVYMFFRIWYEYELIKMKGLVTPPPKGGNKYYYTINKILHDQMGLYKITVGEDMETIMHWAKFWGVYPTSIPRSTFSDSLSESIKFSVSFTSQWIEDMEPTILSDFNQLVSTKKNQYSKDIPIIEPEEHELINGEWCNIPYITKEYSTINDRSVFKLKWR